MTAPDDDTITNDLRDRMCREFHEATSELFIALRCQSKNVARMHCEMAVLALQSALVRLGEPRPPAPSAS